MAITHQSVEAIFKLLDSDKPEAFFAHIAENVHWTILGTHPLAGDYHKKEDVLAATFGRLHKIVKEGMRLHVKHIYVDGETAIVELEARATANNGKAFHNTYCWVVEFGEDHLIKTARIYTDSALVQQLIDENE